jgi:hypothetical protein
MRIQIRGPGASCWESLESERVKYGHQTRGTQIRQCAGEDQQELQTTRHRVTEVVEHQQTRNCLTVIRI